MKSSDDNILYLIVLGVVAGFVGYRILPQAAIALERRMDMTEKEAHRALEESRRALDDAKKAAKNAETASEKAELAQKLTRAISYRLAEDYDQAEKSFLDLRKTSPLNSAITYNLSNTYKLNCDYDKAIKLMNEYIKELSEANIKDLRDANMEEVAQKHAKENYAVYNRACYTILKAFSSKRDDILIAKGLDDLKKSVDLDPEIKEIAWKDKDFKGR